MTRFAALVLALSASLPAAAQEAPATAPATLAPRVRFETSAGNFVVEVDTVRAPLTAENFLRYVRDGAYDGTVFHRVIANFVVQGGGYDERLAERPARGPIPNESGNGLSNRRGTLGLARSASGPRLEPREHRLDLPHRPAAEPNRRRQLAAADHAAHGPLRDLQRVRERTLVHDRALGQLGERRDDDARAALALDARVGFEKRLALVFVHRRLVYVS